MAIILLKAMVPWLAILVLAVINAALREKFLVAWMGPFAGLVASGAVLSCCVLAVAFVAAPWYGPLPAARHWAIGIFWVALTLLFEFGFGHWVQQKDWAELLEAYTFKGGNLWPVVLLVTLVSPLAAAEWRQLIRE